MTMLSTIAVSVAPSPVIRTSSPGRIRGVKFSKQSPGSGLPSGPWLTSSAPPSSVAKASPVDFAMTWPSRAISTVIVEPMV